MYFYDSDYQSEVNSLFSEIDTKYPYPDVLLRLDLIGVLASVETINIDVFIRQVWSKLFPAEILSSNIERKCSIYYKNYRLGFKLMAKSETIQKSMMILKTLIPVTILFIIGQNEMTEIEVNRLKKNVIAVIKPLMNDETAVAEKVDEIMIQYFNHDTVLLNETIQIIKQHHDFISAILEKLKISLLERKRDKRRKTCLINNSLEKNNTDSIICYKNRYNAPLKYIRIVCLMYLALEEHRKTGRKREDLFQELWTKVFETLPYDNETRMEINRLIAADPDLAALDMLFKYSLREIRSGRIVRRIIVALCVHQVLSKLPHGSSEDMVIDEAMTLFSHFSTLSVGKEEDDIEIYLKRFIVSDGNVDDRISRLIWEYADTISEFFKMSLDSINSADNARKRFWWEEILDKKDKEVNALQNQIGATKTNTIFSLVEKLSSPSYNYVLGRLYRFAQGYDSPSHNEIRVALNNLMQVFQLFGIKAIGEKLVDLEMSDSLCDENSITTAVISDMRGGYVTFPGWSVDGDAVVLPIASKKTEDEV